MKLISTVALVLTLGVTLVLTLGAGRAQTEQQPLKMTFSGSTMSTQNILQAGGSPTGEATAAGDSSFGPFSIRDLDAIGAPLPQGSCGEPNSLGFPFVPGGGAVFRFQDGSLLTLKTTGGTLCLDLTTGIGMSTLNQVITSGTGRLKNASGSVVIHVTGIPVVLGAAGPILVAVTGEGTGTILLSKAE